MKRLVLLAFVLTVACAANAWAAPEVVTVDVGQRVKPVDHAASGSLYGIAQEGRPPDALISPLKPKKQLSVNGGQPVKVAAYDATPEGEFATWQTTVNLARGRNTLRLKTVSGTPSLDYVDLQPFRTRVEAESGTITDGRVVFEDPNGFFANHYSGEHYVAFLVDPDSAVELKVNAPAATGYDLVLGYSNGTGAPSMHALAVNGRAAGTVTYPATQFWGLIGTVTVPVRLHAGVNTIRLTNAGGIADLDYVDVAFGP
jgi:hypothetical protein